MIKLILFLIFIIQFVNSQIYSITDVSYQSYETYNKHPITSSSNQCTFYFQYSVISAPSTTKSFWVTSNPPGVKNYGTFVANGTASITSFEMIVPIGINDIATINVGVLDVPTSFIQKDIIYNCTKINEANISFKVLPNLRKHNLPFLNYYDALIKVEGLDLPLSNLDIASYTTKCVSRNTFAVKLNQHRAIPFDVSLNFIDGSYDVTIDSNFNLSTTVSSSAWLYPDPTVNFQANGYKYDPLYKIKAADINGMDAVFYYDKGAVDTEPFPVYGDSLSTTFIGVIDPSVENSPGQSRINVYKMNLVSTGDQIIGDVMQTNAVKIKEVPNFTAGMTSTDTRNIWPIFSTTYSSTLYDYSDYTFKLSDNIMKLPFPFGFRSGNNNAFTFKGSFHHPIKNYDTPVFEMYSIGNTDAGTSLKYVLSIQTAPATEPELISYDIVHMTNFDYLVTMKIRLNYMELGYINLGGKEYRSETLINIDTTNGNYGTYQFAFNALYIDTTYPWLTISSLSHLQCTFELFSHYTIDKITAIINPPQYIYESLDVYSITGVTYHSNNVNVTNKSVNNVIYFTFNAMVSINRPMALQLLDRVSYNPNIEKYNPVYYSEWNASISKFQIEFTIPSNTLPGTLPFQIIFGNGTVLYSSFLPKSDQLYVTSENFDAYGPIFSNIVTQGGAYSVQWKFNILDEINGFDYGIITVRGELDGSIYKHHLTTEDLTAGNKYNGSYLIRIAGSELCGAQYLIITEVLLYDTHGNRASFSISGKYIDPTQNPFINYLGDAALGNIIKIQMTCGGYLDSTPPTVPTFEVDRSGDNLTITFSAQDPDSGILESQRPIVYIQTTQLETLQCVSNFLSQTNKIAQFRCDIEIPYGFGIGRDVGFSVYGVINNGGYYYGVGMSDWATTKVIPNVFVTYKLKIFNTTSITSNGGGLWIIGNGFTSSSIVNLLYYETSTNINAQVLVVFPNAIQIIVGPTRSQILIKVTDNLKTSEIRVIPRLLELTIAPSTPEPSPTITPTNTPTTPTPTSTSTPVFKCPGQLEQCSGTTQGECSIITQGCICYSPWVGLDCSSKVIIVPQPTINTTNPSTEIPIIDDQGGNGGTIDPSNILFKSLVSLVSIRELNFNLIPIKEYKFDSWVHTAINSSVSQYNTNVTAATNVTVLLQWFSEKSVIEFADKELTMNPSTVKYTVSISEYPFDSTLNSLELIMSASFESFNGNDESCLVKEFGSTRNGDNSDYLKIQLNDHSLYGRFIKRAIVDGKVLNVDNVQLDDSMSVVSTSSQSQSFIGIRIPNYKTSITLDPDFSVLLDSNAATSNNENSICSSPPSSKLSTPQLAGIIIGSIGFAAVVTISTVYYIKKKKSNLQFLNKLKNIAK